MHELYNLQQKLNGSDVPPESILQVNVLHLHCHLLPTVSRGTENLQEKIKEYL